MRIAIQVSARDSARAWGILVRHSPAMALANRTFIVSEEAVRALRNAGVKLIEVSREPAAVGVPSGERI